MSRLDKIEELLASPQQRSTEAGMGVAAETECWRCGLTIEPTELGVCAACLTALRDPTTTSLEGDQENADALGDAIGEALRNLAPRVRAFMQAIERMGLTITAHFGVPHPPARPTVDQVIEFAQLLDLPPQMIQDQPCVMHPEDHCSPTYVCEQCPFRYVLMDEDNRPIGFEGPDAPPRIDPNCAHIDPEDGCCAHPDAMTPECWRASDGSRCDCPILDNAPAPQFLLGDARVFVRHFEDGEWEEVGGFGNFPCDINLIISDPPSDEERRDFHPPNHQ